MAQNGKPQVKQLEVPIEDMAVIAANLACFSIACIIGGASNEQAAMTANNILVKEVQTYTAWKKRMTVMTPQIAQNYLDTMNQRIFQEFKQLASISHAANQKQEEKEPWMSRQKLKHLVQNCLPWRARSKN